MIQRFHQTLIFTLFLVLQKSLGYVQPIHIRYSDEQLRALEENQQPIRIDPSRTLIENPYGAQIYYEEILPEDEEILAARNAELQNESFKRISNENRENIPNHFDSPDNVHKFWYHRNNMKPYSLNMQSILPNENNNNNNYYLNYYYVQQYSEYLRELLYDFYFQRQVFLELINQQEQQLQLLRAQFDQLNGAISNTEQQLSKIHSSLSTTTTTSISPNQQNPSSPSLTTSILANQQYPYQLGQQGSEPKPSLEIEKEIEKEIETEQTAKDELNTEDNIENNNEQTNNNNNDNMMMMMNSFLSSSNDIQKKK